MRSPVQKQPSEIQDISFFFGPLPAVTEGAHLLIGLGGTANQVCAGMGVPVVSIEEKGKFVQKKLLGESELLVPATARDLACGAEKILSDNELRLRMAREGRERLGAWRTLLSTTLEPLFGDLEPREWQTLERAAAILAVMDGLQYQWLLEQDVVQLGEATRFAIHAIVDAILGPVPSPDPDARPAK